MNSTPAGLLLAALILLPFPASAFGAALSTYRDDRSTPEAVVTSLYNAIDRHEYLRGWSYFREGPDRPGHDSFEAGYRKTKSVRLKLGKATSEGAAGSVFYTLPVAIEATGTDGRKTVFEGCYELRLVDPSIQATPPFQPMGIVKGTLKKTTAPFGSATGSCAGMP